MSAKKKFFNFDLLFVIINDLRNHRYTLLLYALIVGTLCCTIIITANSKKEIAKLQELDVEYNELEKEWTNLLLEAQTLTDHLLVIDEAEHKLHMVQPVTNNENIIEIK